MQMQYWKNLASGEVYGYDISDPTQVAARDERLAQGSWEDVTANWPPAPPPPTSEQNKAEATRRLAATDWVNQPDVYDPANTPHLTNRSDFLAYRLQVRGIAVMPPAGVLQWPTEPTAVWA